MARQFSLLGLLRLRHAQQDQAGAVLADANGRLRDAADQRVRAKRTLADEPSDVTDAAMLSAIAASRASSRSMLAELDAVTQRRRADVDAAQAAYNEARRAAIGLEKLEEKHRATEAAADLRDEQIALDEIASRTGAAGLGADPQNPTDPRHPGGAA